MTWLSKVGSILFKILGFVQGVSPFVANAFPQAAPAVNKVQSELSQARDIIVTAEAMFNATGLEKTGALKLKAAVPFFSRLIDQSEAFAGLKIADQAKYDAAITGLASAFADLLNSFSPDSAKTKVGQ